MIPSVSTRSKPGLIPSGNYISRRSKRNSAKHSKPPIKFKAGLSRRTRRSTNILQKMKRPRLSGRVKDNLLNVVKRYGIDEQEFRNAVSQTPLFRSAPVQRL